MPSRRPAYEQERRQRRDAGSTPFTNSNDIASRVKPATGRCRASCAAWRIVAEPSRADLVRCAALERQRSTRVAYAHGYSRQPRRRIECGDRADSRRARGSRRSWPLTCSTHRRANGNHRAHAVVVSRRMWWKPRRLPGAELRLQRQRVRVSVRRHLRLAGDWLRCHWQQLLARLRQRQQLHRRVHRLVQLGVQGGQHLQPDDGRQR